MLNLQENQLRILIVSVFFPPLNSIASLRPYSWAKYWAQQGHDVTVLTTKKQLAPVIDLTLSDAGYRVIEVPNIHLVDSLKANYTEPSSASKKTSLISRLIDSCKGYAQKIRQKTGIFSAVCMPDFTDLWIKPAFDRAKMEGPWDLVVSTSGPYAVHFVGHRLKKSGLTKQWIADYRDKWSDNHIFPGMFPFNVLEKILERRLMKMADLITTVSEPYAQSLLNKYGPKVHTIENGFDPQDLECLPQASIFPSDQKFRIVYTGTLYPINQNPAPLFQAIRSIQDDVNLPTQSKNIEVIFVGPPMKHIEEMASAWGVLPWVSFKGFVNRHEALAMQRDADALLFLPWNVPSHDGVLTGKFFEYLYSGTPIMAVGGITLESAQRLMLEAHAGVVLSDAESVKKYLLERMSKFHKERICADHQVLTRYTRKKLAEKMLNLTRQL